MKLPATIMVAILSAGSGLHADEPFRVGLPVYCAFGTVCSVQNYFDLDPGPGRLDPGCGRLSYDGHDGTDFRVRDLVAMREGVTVVAAAEGVVKAIRDGMADVSIRETGREAVDGREAGNGVLIEHDGGWETQYSHLRSGTVAVEPGDRVEAGTALGMIGLSGATEFPHLHFTLRKDGVEIDPYTGADRAWTCGSPKSSFWTEEAAEVLTYVPTGLLIAGFSSVAPDADAVRRGEQRLGQSAWDPEALVIWADVFGAQAGDVQSFRIVDQHGRALLDNQSVLEADNVSWFSFAGRRRPPEGWIPGTYTGTFEISRAGKTIISKTVPILIER
ncbi:M23 family metallopeptidase [Amaricoccus macauensis]|uniref:M23 family metallopeptidase n=1 Tax=Amaricoccus macauensis TaxID=57001 RepID=UPI003C7A0013